MIVAGPESPCTGHQSHSPIATVSVTAGSEITVDGYQSKDGSLRANGRDVTLPNAQTLFIGSPGTGAPSDEKTQK